MLYAGVTAAQAFTIVFNLCIRPPARHNSWTSWCWRECTGQAPSFLTGRALRSKLDTWNQHGHMGGHRHITKVIYEQGRH